MFIYGKNYLVCEVPTAVVQPVLGFFLNGDNSLSKVLTDQECDLINASRVINSDLAMGRTVNRKGNLCSDQNSFKQCSLEYARCLWSDKSPDTNLTSLAALNLTDQTVYRNEDLCMNNQTNNDCVCIPASEKFTWWMFFDSTIALPNSQTLQTIFANFAHIPNSSVSVTITTPTPSVLSTNWVSELASVNLTAASVNSSFTSYKPSIPVYQLSHQPTPTPQPTRQPTSPGPPAPTSPPPPTTPTEIAISKFSAYGNWIKVKFVVSNYEIGIYEQLNCAKLYTTATAVLFAEALGLCNTTNPSDFSDQPNNYFSCTTNSSKFAFSSVVLNYLSPFGPMTNVPPVHRQFPACEHMQQTCGSPGNCSPPAAVASSSALPPPPSRIEKQGPKIDEGYGSNAVTTNRFLYTKSDVDTLANCAQPSGSVIFRTWCAFPETSDNILSSSPDEFTVSLGRLSQNTQGSSTEYTFTRFVFMGSYRIRMPLSVTSSFEGSPASTPPFIYGAKSSQLKILLKDINDNLITGCDFFGLDTSATSGPLSCKIQQTSCTFEFLPFEVPLGSLLAAAGIGTEDTLAVLEAKGITGSLSACYQMYYSLKGFNDAASFALMNSTLQYRLPYTTWGDFQKWLQPACANANWQILGGLLKVKMKYSNMAPNLDRKLLSSRGAWSGPFSAGQLNLHVTAEFSIGDGTDQNLRVQFRHVGEICTATFTTVMVSFTSSLGLFAMSSFFIGLLCKVFYKNIAFHMKEIIDIIIPTKVAPIRAKQIAGSPSQGNDLDIGHDSDLEGRGDLAGVKKSSGQAENSLKAPGSQKKSKFQTLKKVFKELVS